MEEQNVNPVEETTEVVAEATPAEPAGTAEAAVQPSPQKPGFLQRVDEFFGVTARGSNFRTEIVGGLTTFFAMCYILFVNPSQMSGSIGGTVWNSVYVATALSALIGTMFYAVWVKMPYAQAPGMGLNSFFFVSFMLAASIGTAVTSEEKYQLGLSVIFLSGVLFMIISITGIRKKIAEAMPASLKKAIPAGIGLFIALIGFKNAGFVQANQYTFVQLFNMAIGKSNGALVDGVFTFETVTWYSITGPLVMFFGLMMIAFLNKTRAKKFSVILGILFGAGLFYLFNIGNAGAYKVFTDEILNPAKTFVDFGKYGIGGGFLGFKFWTPGIILNCIMLVITFCLVDMFDTLGTLQGTAAEAGMLDENGNPQNLDRCLMADSTATLVGGVLGVSTVTTFVESATGVSAGARTGLSSLVVAFLFLIAVFLSPLASIIPLAAVAPALVYVGVLMLKNIKDVDFNDMVSAVPAFLTVIMMPLSYSISNGIAVGLISYSILKLATVMISGKEGIVNYFKVGKGNWGDFFSKDLIVLIIAILFTLRFFLVSM